MNTLLIVEDFSIIRHGIRVTFEGTVPGFELTFHSSTNWHKVAQPPKITMISLIQATGQEGVNCILEIKRHFPKTCLIGYGMDAIPNIIRAYYNAGLVGYCSLESDDLLTCFRTVKDGKTYFHSSLVNAFISHLQSSKHDAVKQPLTLRQYEIANYIVKGMSNAVIAEKLGITPATVSAIKRAIFKKLDVSSIPELGAMIRTF